MSDTIDQHISIQQSIETYISKGLPPEKEDQLWIEFLKDPDWYKYFIIELHLVALTKEKHI